MKNAIRIKISLVVSVLLLMFAILPSYAQEATSSPSIRDAVREKVREKIEEIIKKPRAVVGTLTEITDSTLEIKTLKDELAQVATHEETTYVRIARGRRMEVDFEDLVLGDFIIAMGFRNGNDVLEAERIVTYDTSPIVRRRAVYGEVQQNMEGQLTIKHPQTEEVFIVEATRNTTITKKTNGEMEEISINDIEAGDRVVAAGTPGEAEKIEAGRIHILPTP